MHLHMQAGLGEAVADKAREEVQQLQRHSRAAGRVNAWDEMYLRAQAQAAEVPPAAASVEHGMHQLPIFCCACTKCSFWTGMQPNMLLNVAGAEVDADAVYAARGPQSPGLSVQPPPGHPPISCGDAARSVWRLSRIGHPALINALDKHVYGIDDDDDEDDDDT